MNGLSSAFQALESLRVVCFCDGQQKEMFDIPKVRGTVLRVLQDSQISSLFRDSTLQKSFNTPLTEIRYIALASGMVNAVPVEIILISADSDLANFVNAISVILGPDFLVLRESYQGIIWILCGALVGMKEVTWPFNLTNVLLSGRQQYFECQNLIAQQQYEQVSSRAQKLPEPLKTAICLQLLKPPSKNEALIAARELMQTMSEDSRSYFQCLLALAEGDIEQMLECALVLSDEAKAFVCDQLLMQGKGEVAQKIMNMISQETSKIFVSCLELVVQGKDAQAILLAQTKLPDSYIPMLCARFLAAEKSAEAMLLAKQVQDPVAVQVLCKEFLVSGFVSLAVELAKQLSSPEMQFAFCQMLLQAGHSKEAMELIQQRPFVEQLSLFQLLLEKNTEQSLRFVAKILQDPAHIKHVMQMLVDKGLVAQAKQLLRLLQDLNLPKDLALILAAQSAKKCVSTSLNLTSEEESFPSDSEEEEEDSEEDDEKPTESDEEEPSE